MTADGGPTIRAALSGDAAALAELGAATFTQTFGHLYQPVDLEAFLASERSRTVYAALLDDPETIVLLAEDESGEPMAYMVAGSCKLPVPDLEPGAGEVRELYVLSSHQGRGLGTRLLEAALESLEAKGRSPLYVGVWSDNEGAQRLYARHGFEKVGEYDFPVGQHLDREFILEKRD